MQNRYVGDVGDFGKYALLRRIGKAGLSLGVNWYLTPDESHNSNGKYTSGKSYWLEEVQPTIEELERKYD